MSCIATIISNRSTICVHSSRKIEVCQAEGVQNAASTLRANIRFSAVDAPLKVVALTSSAPNEGKTTVALSLAIAAGRSGDSVLISPAPVREGWATRLSDLLDLRMVAPWNNE